MSKSMYESEIERKRKFGTSNNTHDNFPIGTTVRVICRCQDHHFFQDDTGTVIENNGEYLGIKIIFHKERHYEGGYIQKSFNFNPDDLLILENNVKKCPHCGEIIGIK